MSINNSRQWIAKYYTARDRDFTNHFLDGSNIQLAPGTYVYDGSTDNFVTFRGTDGDDVLFGGGGENAAFFLGSGPIDFRIGA